MVFRRTEAQFSCKIFFKNHPSKFYTPNKSHKYSGKCYSFGIGIDTALIKGSHLRAVRGGFLDEGGAAAAR